MRQTWRWFGPDDNVTLSDIRQAGAQGIVTALHSIKPGDLWPREAVAKRKAMIESAGLTWDVVESLPISETIRTNGAETDSQIEIWIQSMRNLAAEGVKTICYNFMPVLDWTRTDLSAPMETGARALRFDLTDFAAFDLFVLKRPRAEADYPADVLDAAATRAAVFTQADHDRLTGTILAGLPGAMEHWTLDTFRDRLANYDGITAEVLRENLARFLHAVIPVAEDLGVRLCCHPDDPPWPLFGLPRIMSTEADYRWLVDIVHSPANGITFCAGSLGSRGDNDLPGIVDRLGAHIHFLHLRNVRREEDRTPGSFHEDEHLAGSTDMVAVVKAVLREQTRRTAAGRADDQIPMRPDHGQEILSDLSQDTTPGYPAIGRLKGLAELRGVMAALLHGKD